MRETITTLLPEGEFVNFEDIRKGDTIVRGGANVYGDPMNNAVTIQRAWVLKNYEDRSEWDNTDQPLASVVALNDASLEVQPWYYRINVDAVKADEFTNHAWLQNVVNQIIRSGKIERTSYQHIKPGMTIVVADLWEEEEYGAEIYIGEVGHEDDRGWVLKDEGDAEADFCILFKPEQGYEASTTTVWAVNL